MKFTHTTVAIFLASAALACDMHHHPESRNLVTHFENITLWDSVEAFYQDPFGRCATRDPRQEEKEVSNEIVQDWHSYNERRYLKANKNKNPKKKSGPIVINTVIHIIRDSKGNGPNQMMIDEQMDVLNGIYAPHFQFSVIDLTETVNDAWFGSRPRDANDLAMKSQLHVGGADTLNLYFGGFLGLGAASWPAEFEQNPEYDGVTILYLTMPGAQIPPGSFLEFYNEGKTLVHETGHWLGLLHTFDGNAADGECKGPGDFVSDTSAEAEYTLGCPIGKDTCPGQGLDPIHNYMDYSDDSCMDNFTPGQIERMIAHYKAFRDPDPKSGRFVSCSRKAIGKTRCNKGIQCCGGTCVACSGP